MASNLTSADDAGVALIESLQAAASTPSASSSTAAVALSLSACLAHAADLPYSILGDALFTAIKAGRVDSARQLLQHNTLHREQYAHSDEWGRSSSPHKYKFSRRSHLATAVSCALRVGHSELLPAIHAAGLTHVESSFTNALYAPTRAARVTGLRMATELWGWPEGAAYADLLDHILAADAPECLELLLRHEVMEDGEEELSPDYVSGFILLSNVSEFNRELMRRIQAGLPPFETPQST